MQRCCPLRFQEKKTPKAFARQPTFAQEFRVSPLKLLTRLLWHFFNSFEQIPPPQNPNAPVRVVCLSDTHSRVAPVPVGDVLIHAGNLTRSGTVAELQDQVNWLSWTPGFAAKFVIAGNYDTWLDGSIPHSWDQRQKTLDWKNLKYLLDDHVRAPIRTRDKATGEVVKRDLLVLGKPWMLDDGNRNLAFSYESHQKDVVWERNVSDDTEILITHSPPLYYRDIGWGFSHTGSGGLRNELWRVRPKLHVFGHIHNCGGITVLRWDAGQMAYERACQRGSLGGFNQLFSFAAWRDLLVVIVFAVWVLIKVLCGWDKGARKTVLVNAALIFNSEGKLDSPIQVIDI
ncbi:Metallo-dependent phosphatase [Melanomma pulvis-pyrius CBS 109.77]|uniref:Metallo-dependent phosphatase n=1 Tax=Melanomma pulvis-pyrius CBS 109.77 TaxID=1314802 RepID=A0A6A6X9B7_9PLEO|nr:Metallo-dependent phosphatase [Melanomma pulvis-pyrius CBS 109.77]